MTALKTAQARIGRAEWVRGAFALLVREGIAGVRVEPLALRLKVTKGSFYWHFKDRAALHEAMLAWWRSDATHDIIARVEKAGGDARAKLRYLIELTALNKNAARFETAMRGWARTERKVGEAIAAADGERVAYVASLLRAMGMKARGADVRARIVYLALIGSYFSAGASVPADRDLWREIEALIA
jgi:AcrR family transcriptional regulator